MSTKGKGQESYSRSVHDEAAVQKRLPCFTSAAFQEANETPQHTKAGKMTPATAASAGRYSKADYIDRALINGNLAAASHSCLVSRIHKLTVLQFSRYTKQFLS